MHPALCLLCSVVECVVQAQMRDKWSAYSPSHRNGWSLNTAPDDSLLSQGSEERLWVPSKHVASPGLWHHALFKAKCESTTRFEGCHLHWFPLFSWWWNEVTLVQRGWGVGSTSRQAEPLTVDEEETLWKRQTLGDHNLQSLLNTVFFMIRFYFALWSGDEHRQLWHNPCQIQVVGKPGERPYLLYTEDISKNRPGGLKGCKCKPKVVTHYANLDNPSRCFVRIFKKLQQPLSTW